MKNLFLLRKKGLDRNRGAIFADSLENGKLVENFYDSNIEWKDCEYFDIYITNDEKPKKGEWSIYLGLQKKYKVIEYIVGDEFPKIILTTDQDLIKEGVQAIDDEFLEWFVKNPSCEEVEVEKWTDYKFENNKEVAFFSYKIIIPKEEPKQEYCDCKRAYKEILSGICELCWNEKYPTEQETLEDAASTYVDSIRNQIDGYCYLAVQEGFIEGAKWQAGRMYSEEEMRKAIQETITLMRYKATEFRKHENTIIEQFKKKA